jgi:hypothetical protein
MENERRNQHSDRTRGEDKANTRLDAGAGGTGDPARVPAHDLESSAAPNEDWGLDTQTDEPNRV